MKLLLAKDVYLVWAVACWWCSYLSFLDWNRNWWHLLHHWIISKVSAVRRRRRSLSFSTSLRLDCFYEKRRDTSLHDYNYLPDHWVSELDCLDRCLKVSTDRCRSFEHWRSNRFELCVRANISLSDQPLAKRTNLFVDYYEIDCRKDVKGSHIRCRSLFIRSTSLWSGF